MVERFWICNLSSDLASSVEYPRLTANESGSQLAAKHRKYGRQKQERPTSLEFEFSAQNVHQKLDHRVHWRQSVGEQEESDHDRVFTVKAEGLVQRSVADEGRKESKDIEHMELE